MKKVRVYVGVGVNQEGNLREIASDIVELDDLSFVKFALSFDNLRVDDFIKIEVAGKPFKFVVENIISMRYEEIVDEEQTLEEAKGD